MKPSCSERLPGDRSRARVGARGRGLVAGIVVVLLAGATFAQESPPVAKPSPRPNILLITADDLNCDSVGAYGGRVGGASPTPRIDRLASEGLRFEHGHVTIAVCQPCRAVWMTGLYPHRNGARGFETIRPGVPTVPEALRAAGYLNVLLGKTTHVVPSRREAWHEVVTARELRSGRSPDRYAAKAREAMDRARKEGRPFFVMANSHDPHRPFAGSDQEAAARERARRGANAEDPYPPVADPCDPKDVEVPGFLPDLPAVRREIAEYFTSVRRCDETVGALLDALDDSGLAASTLVIFVSDHGMALPFAKTNCWLHSTRTPWIVRWPGVTRAGSVDSRHVISGVDLAPTILEVAGAEPFAVCDGRSVRSLLAGGAQAGRDWAFTRFHRTAGRKEYEMRAVVGRRWSYIFNPWSDGEAVFQNESQSGRTMAAMRRAAQDSEAIAARVELFLHRVPEELYDYGSDPDALENLIEDAEHAGVRDDLRRRLLEHLRAVDDPVRLRLERLVRSSDEAPATPSQQ